MKINDTITYLSLAIAIICIFASLKDYSCGNSVVNKSKDTLKTVQIIERPVYISDTIKVKSVAWRTKDSIIFVDHEIPCNDTAFIAQSDSIVVPTGDTLNLAFNYANRKGNFSVVFKPRPDSVITNTVVVPIKSDEPYPYGTIIGTFGIGILIGIIGALSK